MPKRDYQGFDDKTEKSVRKWMVDAGVATGKAEAALRKSPLPKPTEDLFTKWFGPAAAPGDYTKMAAEIHKITVAFDQGDFGITYNAFPGPGVWASTKAAVAPVTVGKVIFNMKNKQVDMDFLPAFFKGLVSSGTDHQSQLGTIVHEMSHLAVGTVDAKIPAAAKTAKAAWKNTVAYGAEKARWLADNAPALARDNAENFGFFVSEFL